MKQKTKVWIALLTIFLVVSTSYAAYYYANEKPRSTTEYGCGNPVNETFQAYMTAQLGTNSTVNAFRFSVEMVNQHSFPVTTTGADVAILNETFADGRSFLPNATASTAPPSGAWTIDSGCGYALPGYTIFLSNPTGAGYKGTYLQVCKMWVQLTALLSDPPGNIVSKPQLIPCLGC